MRQGLAFFAYDRSLSLFVAIVFRCCHSRIVGILFSKKEGRQFATKRVTELKQRFEYKLNVLCLGAGNTRFRRRMARPLFDLMSLFVNNLVRHPPPNGNKLFSILWDLKMRFSLERADTYSQRIKFKSFTRWHYLAATNWWSLKFAWINYCRASAAVKSTVAQFMTTPNSGPALPLSYFAWSQLLLAHVFRQLLCCFFIYLFGFHLFIHLISERKYRSFFFVSIQVWFVSA